MNEERLASEVLTLAVKDYEKGKLDVEWFDGSDFEFWCALLNADPEIIRTRIKLQRIRIPCDIQTAGTDR